MKFENIESRYYIGGRYYVEGSFFKNFIKYKLKKKN